MSTTCSMREASRISSRVARKAATSCVGSFWMKPTVSDINTYTCVRSDHAYDLNRHEGEDLQTWLH